MKQFFESSDFLHTIVVEAGNNSDEAEALDYNNTRLRSPVTPLTRYSLSDAFVVTEWSMVGATSLQARRVCEAPGFPSN
jgi:hypothetical protein